MSVPNSIGFLVRDREILLKAIQSSINIVPASDYGKVFSDK